MNDGLYLAVKFPKGQRPAVYWLLIDGPTARECPANDGLYITDNDPPTWRDSTTTYEYTALAATPGTSHFDDARRCAQ